MIVELYELEAGPCGFTSLLKLALWIFDMLVEAVDETVNIVFISDSSLGEKQLACPWHDVVGTVFVPYRRISKPIGRS